MKKYYSIIAIMAAAVTAFAQQAPAPAPAPQTFVLGEVVQYQGRPHRVVLEPIVQTVVAAPVAAAPVAVAAPAAVQYVQPVAASAPAPSNGAGKYVQDVVVTGAGGAAQGAILGAVTGRNVGKEALGMAGGAAGGKVVTDVIGGFLRR
jgi:hypothetical protein